VGTNHKNSNFAKLSYMTLSSHLSISTKGVGRAQIKNMLVLQRLQLLDSTEGSYFLNENYGDVGGLFFRIFTIWVLPT